MAQKTAWTGAALTESDINTYLMGEGGAWTSWTPTVTQSGSVTVTNTRSRYARYGRTIHFTLDVSVTGSGTSANIITVSLPVTAATASQSGIGGGFLFDSSSGFYYPCIVNGSSTTVVNLISTTVSGAAAIWLGATTFTAGLASGDVIRLAGTYEAAS